MEKLSLAALRLMASDSMNRPSTDFPISPLARRIFEIAEQHDSAARIVGGAVRDWLMGRAIGDIDMAINMPIKSAAAAFADNGLRVIETGIDHGTVTVMMAGIDGGDKGAPPQSIEVTQTRIDVETDGRHARVAFSDDWAADAARRDLTINAIYLTADGTIDDPLNGRADIATQRLRFAGDASERVREDALRMLRYCRFLSLFTPVGPKGQTRIDPEARAALEAHFELAANLSGERVRNELKKIFDGADAYAALRLMQESGVARAAIGVDLTPERLAFLPPRDAIVPAVNPWAVNLWIVFLNTVIPHGTARMVGQRLRLSRIETRLLDQLDCYRVDHAASGSPASGEIAGEIAGKIAGEIAGENWRRAAWTLRRADIDPSFCYLALMAERHQKADPEHAQILSNWQAPTCPVTGADLLSQGVDKGPALGQLLANIEARWVASDFTLSKAELLKY